MPDRRHLVVQRGHRGYKLSDQTERRVDFNRQQLLLGNGQHCGEPCARHAIRNDDKPRAILAKALYASNPREAGVLEADQRVDAITERRLERWDGSEVFCKLEHFERLAARTYCVVALAESVLEHRSPRHRGV
jgi:hypothetical protein